MKECHEAGRDIPSAAGSSSNTTETGASDAGSLLGSVEATVAEGVEGESDEPERPRVAVLLEAGDELPDSMAISRFVGARRGV